MQVLARKSTINRGFSSKPSNRKLLHFHTQLRRIALHPSMARAPFGNSMRSRLERAIWRNRLLPSENTIWCTIFTWKNVDFGIPGEYCDNSVFFQFSLKEIQGIQKATNKKGSCCSATPLFLCLPHSAVPKCVGGPISEKMTADELGTEDGICVNARMHRPNFQRFFPAPKGKDTLGLGADWWFQIKGLNCSLPKTRDDDPSKYIQHIYIHFKRVT